MTDYEKLKKTFRELKIDYILGKGSDYCGRNEARVYDDDKIIRMYEPVDLDFVFNDKEIYIGCFWTNSEMTLKVDRKNYGNPETKEQAEKMSF